MLRKKISSQANTAIDRALLFVRTMRYLRWEQFVYRVLRYVQRYLPISLSSSAHSSSAAEIDALAAQVALWGAGDAEKRIERAEAILRGEFCFLNRTERLVAIDWQRRYVSHLWSYNLHYFDYALDLAWAFRVTNDTRYCDGFVDLTKGWIVGNPVGYGDGWESYAVSLRVVNWMYALLLIGDRIDPPTRVRIESSIALQLEYLSRRLELHILANHLQKNLKALVVGGLYFTGNSAGEWLRRGSRLLWREFFEQVLPDGGHYERSPMYHAIALADFLEVIALLRASGGQIAEPVLERVRKMTRAMAVLSSVNGRLHLFNDTADGIAPSREWLSSLAMTVVGEAIQAIDGELVLPDTGYFGYAREADRERLLIDYGPLGPAYQGGHGHCDLLSFEWILNGRPVIVDSGVSGYAGDPHREYVRSTRAHNTVSVKNRDQAEIWGVFRVARRPRLLGSIQSLSALRYAFEGAYLPYHDRRITHRRTIEREADLLVICDRVEGLDDGGMTSFLHLHPDFTITQQGRRYLASAPDVVLEIDVTGAEDVTVVRGAEIPMQGWYCPEFGVALPAPVLVMENHTSAGGEISCRLRVVTDRDRIVHL